MRSFLYWINSSSWNCRLHRASITEATMSKPLKSEEQLMEIDHLIANYQKQLSMLKVEILKLELKKEKLRERIILQSVKSEIAIKRDIGKISSYPSSVFK